MRNKIKKQAKINSEIISKIQDPKLIAAKIKELKAKMLNSASSLEFEKAIELRNKIQIYESYLMEI